MSSEFINSLIIVWFIFLFFLVRSLSFSYAPTYPSFLNIVCIPSATTDQFSSRSLDILSLLINNFDNPLINDFNAIRELSGARSLYRQDIPERIGELFGEEFRQIPEEGAVELSGQTDSLELSGLLDSLENSCLTLCLF